MMTFCPLLQSLHISVAIYLASIARQGKMSHKALAVKWGRRRRFQEHYPWLIFARKKKCHAHPRQFGSGAALHLHQKNAWARSMPGLPGKVGVVGSSSTHLPVFYLHRGEYPKEKAGKGHHGNYARLPIDNTVKPYTNSYPRPLRVLESYEPGPSGQHTPTYSHHHQGKEFSNKGPCKSRHVERIQGIHRIHFPKRKKIFWVVCGL
ncbi:hypothetical protein K456DRAFT_1518531 [Colletotrichum gloeosporioides 23]|nr:hypothetical protein K456DRAFT_1518531 [Colletotrichum gloeosporioides 23]